MICKLCHNTTNLHSKELERQEKRFMENLYYINNIIGMYMYLFYICMIFCAVILGKYSIFLIKHCIV